MSVPSGCLGHWLEGLFSGAVSWSLLWSGSRDRARVGGNEVRPTRIFQLFPAVCLCLGLVGGNSLHKDRKSEVLCGKGKAHSGVWYNPRGLRHIEGWAGESGGGSVTPAPLTRCNSINSERHRGGNESQAVFGPALGHIKASSSGPPPLFFKFTTID